MVQVYGCIYTNRDQYAGGAVIVIEEDGRLTGNDLVGGTIEGMVVIDGSVMVVHAKAVVGEGVISVPNPDYGPMDGKFDAPVMAEVPSNMEVGQTVFTTLEGGSSQTRLQVTRVY